MKYDIFGGMLPAVEITLNKGESVYTQKIILFNCLKYGIKILIILKRF